MVERWRARPQSTRGEEFHLSEVVFRTAGKPATRGMPISLTVERTETYALTRSISALATNPVTGDFRGGRLRHKIATGFVQPCSVKICGQQAPVGQEILDALFD